MYMCRCKFRNNLYNINKYIVFALSMETVTGCLRTCTNYNSGVGSSQQLAGLKPGCRSQLLPT